MANPTLATRLFRRKRLRELPAALDFADLGTAFGLDLSMQSATDEAAARAAAAPRDSGWWRRLAAGRGTPR